MKGFESGVIGRRGQLKVVNSVTLVALDISVTCQLSRRVGGVVVVVVEERNNSRCCGRFFIVVGVADVVEFVVICGFVVVVVKSTQPISVVQIFTSLFLIINSW